MLMNADCGALELGLARARFVGAVLHWGLDALETAALLGQPRPGGGQDPLAAELGKDGETRMRLATAVAHGLDRVIPDDVLIGWLREVGHGGTTPLAFMSRGPTELRAMRAAAAFHSE